MRNVRKNTKGITLIALVITIIVLIILAAVSIAMLTGENGILTKATTAKEETNKNAAKEKIKLEIMGSYAQDDGKLKYSTLKTNLETNIKATVAAKNNDDNFPMIIKLDGYEFEVISNGSVNYVGENNEQQPEEPETNADLKITTAEELKKFATKVNDGETFEGKTVVLMNDIDLSSICSRTLGNWTPIGTETDRFKGTFDGNYHIISNLYILSTENNCGLFRKNEGTIKNLKIKDSYVCATGADGVCPQNYGTLAAFNYGEIVNCNIINGSIKNISHQGAILGGIVGVNSGKITNCCNGSSFDGYACIGGIADKNESGGMIENCYNTGKTTSSFASIGGIVDFNKGEIINCYSTAALGYGYTNIGNVVGRNEGTLSNCYYLNSDVQGIGGEYSMDLEHSTSCDVEGQTESKSEQQLKSLYEILGSAFKADYDTPINNGYPILIWQ